VELHGVLPGSFGTVNTDQPAEVAAAAQPVEIKVRDNGPYKVSGPVRLVDAEGAVFDVPDDRPIALCRCGRSATKPFCDASHKATGFVSCERAGR
jgi:CDGSH iron-sulfur domain-containing protein 3